MHGPGSNLEMLIGPRTLELTLDGNALYAAIMYIKLVKNTTN